MTRVLVVEDSPVTRAAVGDTLAAAGFEVATAPDALVALDELRKAPPGLIVLDLVLPGMSGLTLLAAPEVDSIPLVIATACSGDEELRAGGIPARAAILRKPFTMASLVAVVRGKLAEGNTK